VTTYGDFLNKPLKGASPLPGYLLLFTIITGQNDKAQLIRTGGALAGYLPRPSMADRAIATPGLMNRHVDLARLAASPRPSHPSSSARKSALRYARRRCSNDYQNRIVPGEWVSGGRLLLPADFVGNANSDDRPDQSDPTVKEMNENANRKSSGRP